MASSFKNLPEVRGKLRPTLILIRHGETPFDQPPDRHQGWNNEGLDEKGRRQGRKTAKVLTSLPIREVWSSDLGRAVETARMIDGGRYRGRVGLRPWDVGHLVGKPKKDVQGEVDDFEFEKPRRPIPGGESWNTFRDRYLLQFRALLERAKDDPKEGVVVAVTHSWNFIISLAWLAGGAISTKLDEEVLRHGKDIIPDAGSGLVFTWTGYAWRIRKLPV